MNPTSTPGSRKTKTKENAGDGPNGASRKRVRFATSSDDHRSPSSSLLLYPSYKAVAPSSGTVSAAGVAHRQANVFSRLESEDLRTSCSDPTSIHSREASGVEQTVTFTSASEDVIDIQDAAVQLANGHENGTAVPEAAGVVSGEDTPPELDLSSSNRTGVASTSRSDRNLASFYGQTVGDAKSGVIESRASKSVQSDIDDLLKMLPNLKLERSRSEMDIMAKRKSILGAFCGTPKSANAPQLPKTKSV